MVFVLKFRSSGCPSAQD